MGPGPRPPEHNDPPVAGPRPLSHTFFEAQIRLWSPPRALEDKGQEPLLPPSACRPEAVPCCHLLTTCSTASPPTQWGEPSQSLTASPPTQGASSQLSLRGHTWRNPPPCALAGLLRGDSGQPGIPRGPLPLRTQEAQPPSPPPGCCSPCQGRWGVLGCRAGAGEGE